MIAESFDTSMLIRDVPRDPDFPNAPLNWSQEETRAAAEKEGLELTGEHWEVMRALQDYYARHDEPSINLRELHDALDEKFHAQGGVKYLYQLFPGGPIAQGCRLAGLKAPFMASDRSFGSVS